MRRDDGLFIAEPDTRDEKWGCKGGTSHREAENSKPDHRHTCRRVVFESAVAVDCLPTRAAERATASRREHTPADFALPGFSAQDGMISDFGFAARDITDSATPSASECSAASVLFSSDLRFWSSAASQRPTASESAENLAEHNARYPKVYPSLVSSVSPWVVSWQLWLFGLSIVDALAIKKTEPVHEHEYQGESFSRDACERRIVCISNSPIDPLLNMTCAISMPKWAIGEDRGTKP